MKTKLSTTIIIASITILFAVLYSYYSIESFTTRTLNCGDKFCDPAVYQTCSDKISPDAVKEFGLKCMFIEMTSNRNCSNISNCKLSKEECEKKRCPNGERCDNTTNKCLSILPGKNRNTKYIPVSYTKCGNSFCDRMQNQECTSQIVVGPYSDILVKKYGSICVKKEKVIRKNCNKDSNCKNNEICYKGKCASDISHEHVKQNQTLHELYAETKWVPV